MALKSFPFSAFLFQGFVWVDLCAHASQIDELPLKDDQIKSEAKRSAASLPHKLVDKVQNLPSATLSLSPYT